ncbi:MAG: TIR domain-containing protein, partial [Candidatus Nealsonbacteria bacterium]|nr:TIR domain-containing protein [Candidatus Nealsonbacteria bacterium]
MPGAGPQRVFISYSHDNRGHADRVAALSARLRHDGIDCQIDQYQVRPPGGWPDWMRDQIADAHTVLVVCTEIYCQRFEGRQPPGIGRGVRWESVLMENRFYRDAARTDKLLPVVFHRDDEEHIPDLLYGLDRACVDPDNLDGDGYSDLLRLIHREPPLETPPLGVAYRTAPDLPPLLPALAVQESFFQPDLATGAPDELLVQIHALPITGPELFGRATQLQRLTKAWTNSRTNVISLVAPGGVGKSALVNHWLGQMALDDYRGARRVYGWSAYSQGSKERTTAADLFIDRALRFFGDPDPEASPIEQRAVRLAGLIRRQPTLLILDGIESLQYAPGEGEGHIKDVGLRTLVRELAARNAGLCVITTRQRVADLAAYETTTCPKIDLEKLQPADGARLLESLDVNGTDEERQAASEEFDGHALALTLLGTLLRDAHAGDVRKWREVGQLEHEISQGGHARRVMDSYEDWLGDGPERSILRMLGLFDRPAEGGAIRALRAAPPIDGLTDKLDDWTTALIRLRHARLVAAAEASEPDTLA